MAIERWSENVVLMELPGEPKTADEIESIVTYIREHTDCGVVLDFTDVTILTSLSLASLLRLNKLLEGCGQRLSLCCVSKATRGIIAVTGLDEFFEIFEDRFDALATIQAMPESTKLTRK